MTINQNIPITGLADVTISIETAGMIKDIKILWMILENRRGSSSGDPC